MVLQANPTKAVVWGFLDGNTNEVKLDFECILKENQIVGQKSFNPKRVSWYLFFSSFLFDSIILDSFRVITNFILKCLWKKTPSVTYM